jgi:hypothetical protein
MLAKVAHCFVVLRGEEKCLISHSPVTKMSSGSKRKSKPHLIVALRNARGVELKTSPLFRVYLALIFTCKKLVGSIYRNSLIQCNASFQVRSTFLAFPNAQLKTFFLMRSVVNFGQHGTSNSRQKPEIGPSFQLVSHLWFIVLWPDPG